MRLLTAQLARFGAVGLVGLVVDVVVFNLLRATVLDPTTVAHGSLMAKLISTSLAILVNYIGNRYWTFSDTRRTEVVREGFEFVLVSVGGMLIALACLWVSRYVFGFTSVLADNISSNVIGLVLGTAFRFAFYRFWVFNPDRARESRPAERPIQPAGLAPLGRIQAVSTIQDHTRSHD